MLKNTGNIIIAISITNTVIGFFSLDDKNNVNPTIPNNTVYEITILYKSDWKNVSAYGLNMLESCIGKFPPSVPNIKNVVPIANIKYIVNTNVANI